MGQKCVILEAHYKADIENQMNEYMKKNYYLQSFHVTSIGGSVFSYTAIMMTNNKEKSKNV